LGKSGRSILAGGRSSGNGSSHRNGSLAGGRTKGSTESILFIIALTGRSLGRVKTPLGSQRTVNLLGSGKLEVASLLGDNSTLVLRSQTGDKLGDELADLLGVQVTHLLWNINNAGDHLLVALLISLSKHTSSSADLNRQLLTAGVSYILARLLLNILGCTGGLVDSLTNFLTLAVTFLGHGLVALLNGLIEGLLLESNLTGFLKVLIAHLLLGGHKLGDIGVVTLLSVLVGALQDGILFQSLDCLLLLYTAQTSLIVLDTSAEVNAALDGAAIVLSALSGTEVEVGAGDGGNGCE